MSPSSHLFYGTKGCGGLARTLQEVSCSRLGSRILCEAATTRNNETVSMFSRGQLSRVLSGLAIVRLVVVPI